MCELDRDMNIYGYFSESTFLHHCDDCAGETEIEDEFSSHRDALWLDMPWFGRCHHAGPALEIALLVHTTDNGLIKVVLKLEIQRPIRCFFLAFVQGISHPFPCCPSCFPPKKI